MIIKIAWRNIWRSKLRSLLMITTIALGIFGGIFMMAFNVGMTEQRARDIIETQCAHIQVHNPDYTDEKEAKKFISGGMETFQKFEHADGVVAASPRTIVLGMIAGPKQGAGVQINGVYPDLEAKVTTLQKKMTEGDFLPEEKNNAIVIGEKLAEKLKVKIRKKVVLTFQTPAGEITRGNFRISGTFKTVDSKFDESNVFVQAKDLQKLLGKGEIIHEIAIQTQTTESAETVKNALATKYPDLKIEDWKELKPSVKFMVESLGSFMLIFIGIILLALLLGIINTMLMAVLERKRELGMLMSVGMNKTKVFSMILLETLFLSIIGGGVGLLLAWASVSYFGIKGIDLSMFSQGLESLGFESVVYLAVDSQFYFQVAGMVMVAAVLAAIYPAIKALKLNPVEAVRAI